MGSPQRRSAAWRDRLQPGLPRELGPGWGFSPGDDGRSRTCPSAVVSDAPLRSVAYTSSANCPRCLCGDGTAYSATAPYQSSSEADTRRPQAPGYRASSAAAPRMFCPRCSSLSARRSAAAVPPRRGCHEPGPGYFARSRTRQFGTTAIGKERSRGQVHQPVTAIQTRRIPGRSHRDRLYEIASSRRTGTRNSGRRSDKRHPVS